MHIQQTAETEHKNTLSQEGGAANRTGIPDLMKKQYESLSGLAMDDVRVHYNSARPSQLGALAYTQGRHVYVAPGQERHLGHELGHVIQQKKGRVRATDSLDGVAVNLDDGLEREADVYDRQARAYGTGSRDACREEQEPGNPVPETKTGLSGGVAQLRPVVDKRRNRPFYMDDKYQSKSKKLFLFKLFVEMGNYIVFQIRDHVRRFFWEKDQKWAADNPGSSAGLPGDIPDLNSRKTKEDDYYTDRNFENKLDIDEVMSQQPLDAWLETYEEAMGTLTEIDADTALSPEEKRRQKDAITNYVLQRHIVNALYRAEELDRMEYSGSPLSYQDRSSYMRSGAGSFVDMLKQVLLNKGNPFSNKDLILTRSAEMRQELNKFFYYIPLSGEETMQEEIEHNLSDTLIDAIARFIVDLRASAGETDDRALQRGLEEQEFPQIFADATDRPQNTDIDSINQILRDTVLIKAAGRMDLSGDPAAFLWVKKAEAASKAEKVELVNSRLRDYPIEGSAFFNYYVEKLNQEIASARSTNNKKRVEAAQERLTKIKTIQQNMRFSPEDNRLATAYVDYVKAAIPPNSARKWELLYRNMGLFAATGEMITLENEGIQQSALLLADTGMDKPAKAAVNKAGYVPSITEAVRMLTQYRGDQELQPLPKQPLQKKLPQRPLPPGEPPQQAQSSLQWIAHNVYKQQVLSQWSRAAKVNSPEARTDRESAIIKAEDRVLHPRSAQYQADDAHGARELAETGFELFCQWLGRMERVPEKKGIVIQASVIKKLIIQSRLFTNRRIPSFVWYQLDYYLEAAQYTDENIVDFSRNIQALHEIILLGIELAGEEALPRGTDFTLKEAEQADQVPGSYQGAYLADYGLKAFAQVYDAAAVQHGADAGTDPLQIAAFYNIYFELTEKLNKTTESSSGKVSMTKPKDVSAFLADINAAAGPKEFLQKLPDIIMIDIHPNDATKEIITQNDVSGMLDAINYYMVQNNCRRKITVIIDITLNQAMDLEVQEIIKKSKPYVADGWLNLVFVQSLTKFAQMGMDKHSGGLVFSYNKADEWTPFNDSLQESRQADPVDPYMQRYFQMLFDNAADEQRDYINIIRANTRYVQERLSAELAGTAVMLSVNDDEGSCYVAWHYRDSYSIIKQLFEQKGRDPYSLHEFNIAILEAGINSRMSKQKLPVAMRFSFGFPISNLGETGDEVRFTIGMETEGELEDYIREIKLVGETVQNWINDNREDILLDLNNFQQNLRAI